jgi:hypothetical protein
MEPQQRCSFEALLGHMSYLEEEKGAWIKIPGGVDRRWKRRTGMKLVHHTDNGWRIEGSDAS